ncbi:MAG: dihydrofolate reductase family protein [Muribaculum sp.]|nr:dihydrofolate reductase family protein [Muribaculum sp.]
MRPYIICHMVASIDGRIDCSMVDKISGDEYYSTLERLNCDATLEGRVTMEHYNADKEQFIAKDKTPVGRPSVNVADKSGKYIIAVDTTGKLKWSDNQIDGDHLVCIVSEQVPKEYIDKLKSLGISWICTGKDAIDLNAAMEILSEQFGVSRLAVLGGGNINGGFLNAGLIDEVSLLLAPGIDGRKGMTALFDGIADEDKAPTKLSLHSVDKIDNGVINLRYRVYRED